MIFFSKKSNNAKKLISNFMSLSILQIFSYIFPLLTIPYLVRVLGIEYFGLIAFATAISAYFVILTQYGFELTAVREISMYKEDKKKLTEIFSSVLLIKLVLLVISFIILLIIISFFDKFKFEKIIYILSFGLVIGDVLFPKWFFQGIEKMKYITYINVTSRIIFTLAIFVFIQEKNDFYLVPILNSLGLIFSGLYSIYFIYRKFEIKLELQSYKTIEYYLKDSWYIFISHISINLYTNGLTIILGLFSSMTVVGYYSAADKLIKAVISLSQPIYQTVYPHIMQLMKESEEKALVFIKKVVKYSLLFSIIVSISLFILSDKIIYIIYGQNYDLSIVILKTLCFLPVIVGLNNIIGVQVMLAYNLKKEFSKIVVYLGLSSLFISIPLGYFYEAIGIAISAITVELTILLSIILFLIKKNKFLWGRKI